MDKPVERVFVDSNVLVQSAVKTAPLNAAALNKLHLLRQDDVELWTSRQVLREYLVALTQAHAGSPPVPPGKAAGDVAFLQMTISIAEETADVMAQLLTLVEKLKLTGKQIHDANIVAVMQAHGIRRLLTATPADYAVFDAIIFPMALY